MSRTPRLAGGGLCDSYWFGGRHSIRVGPAGLSQFLRRELYGISHLDPLAYVAAIGLFAITAALAAWWPARRSLRIDPLRALRYE